MVYFTGSMAEDTALSLLAEFVVVLMNFLYHLLEAAVLAFVPASVRRKDVTGQIVLITGAGSGIGRLMAIKFAALGCHLVLWDISEQGNQATADEIKDLGAKVNCYRVDVSKKAEIYKAAEKVKLEVGDVDILVNNAGIVTGKKLLECPDVMVEKTLEVNSFSHFWTVKSFLPGMLDKNRGHVVTVASSAGVMGVNGLAYYCSSKFAAVGFIESLRFELEVQGKTDIHTTVVCPYTTNTGMFAGVQTRFPSLMPILDPEYVAHKIVNAVLINQEVLYIPRLTYVILGLKGILPTKCTYVLCRFFGATALMDTFVGRQRSEGSN